MHETRIITHFISAMFTSYVHSIQLYTVRKKAAVKIDSLKPFALNNPLDYKKQLGKKRNITVNTTHLYTRQIQIVQ